ncbi:probable boron transporter 6 isoform X2 [Actinidia eriantha]|uniref:probable boron transporter 6 isoform X2 n=1 Tax=Actinidia eriantha TaxID=165200 RepID=UPI00258E1AA4|nr:probable boron transporter 6 isoform X2 [Actinidia eriantha]XP_057503275.1 probable boron transporter 6 isoform X2 [Actinidia eriantha]
MYLCHMFTVSCIVQLVHPAYVTMLGHLRSKTLERFKTCLEQSLHRGERYAVSVRYCNRAYMLEFDQGCAEPKMDNMRSPFKGVINDIQGRLSCYKQDWVQTSCGFRILAPTAYIFFASALPVIAFGEQLSRETDGSLSTIETLASTAICGIIHSVFGGQPLLILGVAEPTVIMYTYLYNFSKGRPGLGRELFLAWAGWVCVWTSILLFLLAIFNACTVITRFTRIAGELFGMLIAVLFIQEAIKGVMSEFHIPKSENPKEQTYQFQWLYTNGLLAVIFSFGLVFSALKSRRARSWRYGTVWLRSFIADYGVPLMVLLWTALSYSVPGTIPSGVPRRLFCPLPWEAGSLYHWTVIKDMGKVPVAYIFIATIPAVMIAGLYFFDHSVASQMAQQKEYNLKKTSAYHYDILLLGVMTLLCGLLGLPPSNGVLPQSPMHTRSLAVLKRQLIRKKMVKSAKECIKMQASNSEIYGKMQAVFIEMDTTPDKNNSVDKELENLKEAVMNCDDGGDAKGKFDPEKHIDAHLPVRVNEQRVSNLLQSLLVGVAMFAIPVIRMIPTSVLWGYFAYMAIDSLPGNQFWERLLLLFITPCRRFKVLEGVHASFVESVPFKYIVTFTLFQLLYFLVCFGITWIPIAGILFPLPFFLLISIREHILPQLFPPHHLQELDAAEYEEMAGLPVHTRSLSLGKREPPGDEESPEIRLSSQEILDEITTHRGELKLRSISFSERQFQVHPEHPN